jgi:hypothetical protein
MSNKHPSRILFIGLVIVIGLTLIGAAAALGQTGVDIPLDRVYRGDPGEIIVIAEIGATNEIGWTCGAFLERHNNKSMHEGTNLGITSGANGTSFNNIESAAFEEAVKAFVIDGDITITIQLGEDGVASMGFTLEFECNPPPTTTSSTTTTPTTSPVTTTTEPPPINGVDTGGGSLQHLIAGSAVDDNREWAFFALGAAIVFAAGVWVWAVIKIHRRNR